MDFEAVSRMVLEQFSKNHIRCAVIGGFALHAAGFPRATKDIDFLVHVDDLPMVKNILIGLGYDIVHESSDVVNFWGKLKELGGIDFIVAHRKYALAMLQRAKPYEIIDGYTVQVAVPEDIIGLKLQAIANDPERASQDMADIEWLIKHHHKVLDRKILEEYFGLFDRIEDLTRLYQGVKNA